MKALLRSTIAITGLCAAALSHAAELRIDFDDIKAGNGMLMVAVYTADTYMKRPFVADMVPADAGTRSLSFKDLPPGDYAVAVFLDANRNGKLDRNGFGIPTEDHAFSNNARGTMGPPSFEQTRLTVPEAGLTTHISLR